MEEMRMEALRNLLKTTDAASLQLALGRLILYSEPNKLSETDKLNIVSFQLFLKQVEQE